jgi:RNA polymerase sigma-70 factor, ECF subfamily
LVNENARGWPSAWPTLSNPAGERRLEEVQSVSDVAVIQNDESDQDFDRLFAAKYAALARIVYRVVGDTGRAEEVAAEAFWKLHSKPPASNHNLEGWLYRTGLRLALDHLKKGKRRAHYEAQAPAAHGVQGPEEALEQQERRARVRRVLAALKPERAGLLVLRCEGYSLSEMASILGVKPNSVGNLLARAEEAFRKEYVKRYGER